jgi:hypothetical protein
VAQEDAELKHAVALSQAMEEQRLKAICEEVLPAPSLWAAGTARDLTGGGGVRGVRVIGGSPASARG